MGIQRGQAVPELTNQRHLALAHVLAPHAASTQDPIAHHAGQPFSHAARHSGTSH